MGILDLLASSKVPRLDIELTSACDHGCGHCYNVWNNPAGERDVYPRGQLATADYVTMLEKALRQSGAEQVTITGGEPLLRKDALDIIDKVTSLARTVQLITNGSHVTPEVASRLARARVRSVQLTFLAATPALHNRLKGADCFEDTVGAALNLREARVPAHACFVATSQNWRELGAVMELCLALGIQALSYNRMSSTGAAVDHIGDLMPSVEQIEANLETADRLGRRWGIRVSTAMPIPPCLIRLERYPWVQFGFCSTGTASPNLVIDPLGNVRSCNLSRGILGNLLRQDWSEIMRNPYQRRFRRHVPEVCRGCAYETSCQGGCKESALAAYGTLDHAEPFLSAGLGTATTAPDSARVRLRVLPS